MQSRRAFTLIELLVVIAIIAILAAILFPVFAQAKKQAKGAADLSNVKQEGLALLMYANDVDDLYPWGLCANWYPDGWVTICQPYVKNMQIYRSPLETSTSIPWGTWTGTAVSYAGNAYMIPVGADVRNSATLASWCAPPAYNANEPVSCVLHGIMSWTAQVSGQQSIGGGGMMDKAALTTTEVTQPANTIALTVRFNGDALKQNPGSPGNVTQFDCGGVLHSLPATNGSWLGDNMDWCGGSEIPNGKRAIDLNTSHGRYGAVSQIRDNGKSNFVLCDGHAKLLDIASTNPDPDNRWDLNMWDALR
ncbi:MAG TPA: prepilin-type N-terminal cleavage/methylation domain-containing protein [Fimbriimonadaceae bacterium]|nr:prepilin-type N-terminal cleavage/methylation domain-containing protein [Fimbriimonadaceae bacterium]